MNYAFQYIGVVPVGICIMTIAVRLKERLLALALPSSKQTLATLPSGTTGEFGSTISSVASKKICNQQICSYSNVFIF